MIIRPIFDLPESSTSGNRDCELHLPAKGIFRLNVLVETGEVDKSATFSPVGWIHVVDGKVVKQSEYWAAEAEHFSGVPGFEQYEAKVREIAEECRRKGE